MFYGGYTKKTWMFGWQFACPYSECFAPFTCPCPANTLESLATHHSNYQAAGSKKSTAMKYNNCTQPALISGSPDKTMLEVFSFPELHVMTGIVGKLVKEMIAALPNREAGKSFINLFMKQHNISCCDYIPGTLEGYQAHNSYLCQPCFVFYVIIEIQIYCISY